MPESLRQTFRSALADHAVALATTDRDGLAETLASVIDPPAVAAPVPYPVDLEAIDGLDPAPTPAAVRAATTGVTAATVGVADTGSVLLEPGGDGTEPVSLYPDHHVAVLDAADIVADVGAAFEYLEAVFADGGDAVLATGPSATADMGELVYGAHGPSRVTVLLMEGSS
ncbi:MAG: LUD domain-containing protein [Halobacteriaceae archaeon]